jgi:hypothetical protein
VSLLGSTTVQAGTAATAGAPSTVVFNGLAARLDGSSHYPGWRLGRRGHDAQCPRRRVPYLTGIKVLVRRDTAIL